MWSPREQPRRSTRLWKSFGKRSRTAAAASGTDMSSSRAHVACQGKRGKKNGNLPGKTLGKRIFLLPDLTPAGTSRGFLFFIFFPQNSRGFGGFSLLDLGFSLREFPWIWGFPSQNFHGFGFLPPRIIPWFPGNFFPDSLAIAPGFPGNYSVACQGKKNGNLPGKPGKKLSGKGFPPPFLAPGINPSCNFQGFGVSLPKIPVDLGFFLMKFPWIWGFLCWNYFLILWKFLPDFLVTSL